MAEKGLTIQQKKEWAKLLYTKDGVTTQKELAIRVGVSERTMSKWVNDENWEKLRASIVLTREEQLRNLYDQWTELNKFIKKKKKGEQFPDSREADILSKLSNAIEKLEGEVNITSVIDSGKGFIAFVRRVDPESVFNITTLYDSYIKSLL